MQTDLPHLMNLIETAEALSVSPHAVHAWVRKRRLQPTRICRRLLFLPSEGQRLIDSAAERE
jgi:hypothetical protein